MGVVLTKLWAWPQTFCEHFVPITVMKPPPCSPASATASLHFIENVYFVGKEGKGEGRITQRICAILYCYAYHWDILFPSPTCMLFNTVIHSTIFIISVLPDFVPYSSRKTCFATFRSASPEHSSLTSRHSGGAILWTGGTD